jgi:hypothetical protein
VTIADSEALRAQRYRLHRAGDHSLCVRCAVLRAGPGAASEAVPVTDPAKGLRLLAGQLTAAYGADLGNALLARELRMTLQALLGARDGARGMDGDLADLFAELGAS